MRVQKHQRAFAALAPCAELTAGRRHASLKLRAVAPGAEQRGEVFDLTVSIENTASSAARPAIAIAAMR